MANDRDKSKLHDLVGKAMSDDNFAKRLLNKRTRKAALEEAQSEVSPTILDEVEHSAVHLRRLMKSFGGDQAAS